MAQSRKNSYLARKAAILVSNSSESLPSDILSPLPSQSSALNVPHVDKGNGMPMMAIDYDILLEEIVSIQRDLHELLMCLDRFIADESDDSDDDEPLPETSSFLKQDELTGERCINWTSFGPFADEVIVDMEQVKLFKERSKDLVRRVRVVMAFHPEQHNPCLIAQSDYDGDVESSSSSEFEHSFSADEAVQDNVPKPGTAMSAANSQPTL